MKIIVKIKGGIGNQLFQYAIGKSLSERFNCTLKMDLSSYADYSYDSKFELNKILETIKICEPEEINEGQGVYFLNERYFNSIEDLKNLPFECKSIVIDGYWQHERYFDKKIINDLYQSLDKKYSQITKLYEEKFPKFQNSVAVHVRRRDYSHMGLCTDEYYIACINEILKQDEFKAIFLFSDEPNSSLNFLNSIYKSSVILVKSDDDLADLYLLSKFKNIVISNSTYSWWAAYFDEVNKDNIIYPDPWIVIDEQTKPCPIRWRKVSNAVRERKISLELIEDYKSQLNSIE